MARIFVSGSTTGLGLAAALDMIDAGHDVVVHARNRARAAELGDVALRAAAVVIGDLAEADETRRLATDLDAIGEIDAVIHNAGVYAEAEPHRNADGHPRTLAVNLLAPYVLTALTRAPARLVYLSTGMHHGGTAALDDLDWTRRRWNGVQAYSDSKLLLTTFAATLARRWPDVAVNSVDPGWVPTRMGGPSAPDDLTLGHTTQTWLATSVDPEASTSGGYWFHGERQQPAAAVNDHVFQDALVGELERISGVPLLAHPTR